MSLSDDTQAEKNTGLRRALTLAPVYNTFQRAIGSQDGSRRIVEEVIRSDASTHVLDIGCGPAEIADRIAFASYTGIDPNPSYVDAAQRRLGGRGVALVGDVADPSIDERLPAEVGLAMMLGVLHHLDDRLAHDALALAARRLSAGGRFVSIDPGLVDGQPKLARFLALRDRGQHVRAFEPLRALFSDHFDEVHVTVHHNFLRVPYTHLVVQASKRAGEPGATTT